MKRLLLVSIAVGLCGMLSVQQASAQGRAIGRSVSALARNGIHGPQLAALVHRLQAAQGIGAVNGKGAMPGAANGKIKKAKKGKGQII